MTKIIAFNGFKRSGKGESANAASRILDGVVYQMGFADKLKQMAALALGYEGSPQELIALMDEFKENGQIDAYFNGGAGIAQFISGRQYLQNFGNEARKLFGEDFWVDQVLPRPSAHPDQESRWLSNVSTLAGMFPEVDALLLTDLRYPNEAYRVKSLYGLVIEVVRPEVESDGHASETPLPRELVDYTVPNDGTLDELEDKIAGILAAEGLK